MWRSGVPPTPGWRLLEVAPAIPPPASQSRLDSWWGRERGRTARGRAGASSLIASPGSEPGDNLAQGTAAWWQESPALPPPPPLGTDNDHGRWAAPPRPIQADRRLTSFVLLTYTRDLSNLPPSPLLSSPTLKFKKWINGPAKNQELREITALDGPWKPRSPALSPTEGGFTHNGERVVQATKPNVG